MDTQEQLIKLEKKIDDNVIKVILENIKDLFMRTDTYSRLTNGNKKDIDNMHENFRIMRNDMKAEIKIIRNGAKWMFILIVTGILIPILLFIIEKIK